MLSSAIGFAVNTLQEIWRAYSLLGAAPPSGFELNRDPQFAAKVRDIIGPLRQPLAHVRFSSNRSKAIAQIRDPAHYTIQKSRPKVCYYVTSNVRLAPFLAPCIVLSGGNVRTYKKDSLISDASSGKRYDGDCGRPPSSRYPSTGGARCRVDLAQWCSGGISRRLFLGSSV